MKNQIKPMVDGLNMLLEGLKTHSWPDRFFLTTMGFSEETTAKLPEYAKYFLILYFAMAALALVLHFWKKQKSLSTIRGKITDMFLMAALPLILRIMVFIFQVGQELAAQVPGEFSVSMAGLDWIGKMVATWFYPMGLCLILLVIAAIPFSTVIRYLKTYALAGLPWIIYDVGFGLLCFSAAVLAMFTGNPVWYVSIAAAAVLVFVGQTGGVIKE